MEPTKEKQKAKFKSLKNVSEALMCKIVNFTPVSAEECEPLYLSLELISMDWIIW